MGTEAIHEFIVRDFPAFVAIDSQGKDVYELVDKEYRRIT
jgi:tartrate dehydratase beta subunit/fumarate hydratase class I family protein